MVPPPEDSLEAFLQGELESPPELSAASLFSGAGIADWGFRKAGFRFTTFLEKDPKRARVIKLNFPDSKVIVGLAEERLDAFVREACREGAPRLLTITPPCAGFSSAGVGKPSKPSTDDRDLLALTAARAARQIRPAFVFLENVPGFLSRKILHPGNGREATPYDAFLDGLPDYEVQADILRMADFGVPQRRERLVAVLARRGEFDGLSLADLFPLRTHSEDGSDGLEKWPAARKTLADYAPLDGRSPEEARDAKDLLHVVPSYTKMRYSWVSRIPPHSGKSAYDNSECETCGRKDVPRGVARCGRCHAVMRVRPRIYDAPGRVRLIKGQHTSYRRMSSDLPIPTITTNNGHYGGDTKIHPWQNRVLSIREILDHQTVPRDFQWPEYRGRPWITLIRESVGESVPPWFTFRLGRKLYFALSTDSSRPSLVSTSRTMS